MYFDRKKLKALLKWYMQEIGEDIIAALIVDRTGLLIESLTRSSESDGDQKFIGAFSVLVELVLKRITKDFELGTFGAGTFDTDQYRFIFCEAGPDFVFITILDASSMVDPYFPYSYLAAEKIARIFDGRPVSPVIPRIIDKDTKQLIKRKVDILQKVKLGTDFAYKLILGGDGGVGKTSMVHRFIENIFQADYKATIGVYIAKKECIFEGLDGKIRFMIWDLAGQEQFKRLRQIYLHNSEAGILVYDITDRKSFDNVKNWCEDFKKSPPREKILILVGNKIDLEDSRVVSTAEGVDLAKQLDLPFIETSAKTGENIDDAFRILALSITKKYLEAIEVYKIVTEKKAQVIDETEDQEKIEKMINLRNYETISISDLCDTEDMDFSSWLKTMIHYLNDSMDVNLTPIISMEESDDYFIDFLAVDEFGNKVIIENQFYESNQKDLGFTLACLAHYDAKMLIWLCEESQPDQEKAIRWLNKNTPSDVLFYLLKVEIFKIKNYEPIPRFTVITGPSEDIRRIKVPDDQLDEIERMRIEFWKRLVDKTNKNFPEHTNMKILKTNWIFKSAGKTGLSYTYIIKDKWYAIELYFGDADQSINKERFKELQKKNGEIQKDFNEISWHLSNNLDWNYEESRNYQSIRYRFDNAGLKDEQKWDEIQYNMIDAMKCLVQCTQKHIKNLKI